MHGHLQFPKGLTIHNDKVYVADSGNKCISVFLTNGTHSTRSLGDNS